MTKKIAIIGAGNMGSAMIRGFIKSEFIEAKNITATNLTTGQLQGLRDEFEIKTTNSNIEAVTTADIVILAVKPYLIWPVITELKSALKADAIVISIATGFTLSDAAKALGENVKFARAMPNTPAQVGLGMTGIVPNGNFTTEEKNYVLDLFRTFGKAEIVDEQQLNAVTGISGSSPTLVYMMIDAMADAAVHQGLTREQGLLFAAQTVKGAAEMVLQTGKHPGELKDMVCTPGGTSIEEVYIAEKMNLRGTITAVIIAGAAKARQLNEK